MSFTESYGLCRSCHAPAAADARKCANCGGFQLLFHPELPSLSIAHLDCDAFYAAIEKRDNPALAHEPVIVGGGVRGVVATCCYIARSYGVRSAMPMFQALKACPGAVVIKPNMAKYVETGRAIRQMMLSLTPLVEPLSIDEAFLDLSGTERLHGAPPATVLSKLQKRIEQELGVTASVGLSHNKFLAKIASDLDKPKGFTVVGKTETMKFLARMPVRKIWGVGAAFASKLEKDGITNVAQLQTKDGGFLAKQYGEMGLRLAQLSRGEDARPVKPHRETKSFSSETTFNEDIDDIKMLEDILWELCEKVSARMKTAGFEGRTITLKLKSNTFKTVTRRTSLDRPSNLARIAFAAAKTMLNDTAGAHAYRLIGVGFSNLSPSAEGIELEMFASDRERIAAQEKAIDALRAKFGETAVRAGRSLRKEQHKEGQACKVRNKQP